MTAADAENRRLQQCVDRLYEREREERNERRGLEQRAVTTLGVLLVAAGLVVNAHGVVSQGTRAVVLGCAGIVGLLAGFYLLLPLCGLHLQDDNWLRPRTVLRAVRGDSGLATAPEAAALTGEDAEAFTAYVEQLSEANRRAAIALRLGNVCLLVAFTTAVLGLVV